MEALSSLAAQQGAEKGEEQGHRPDHQGRGHQSHRQIGQGHPHRQGIQAGGQGQGGDLPPLQAGECPAGLGLEGGEQLYPAQVQKQAEGDHRPQHADVFVELAPRQPADQRHAGLERPEPAGQPQSIPELKSRRLQSTAHGCRAGVHRHRQCQKKYRYHMSLHLSTIYAASRGTYERPRNSPCLSREIPVHCGQNFVRRRER